MGKGIVFVTVSVMMFLVNNSFAGDSVLGNGSFEDDGRIGDITVTSPNDWDDVNIPAGQFDGNVDDDWVTERL